MSVLARVSFTPCVAFVVLLLLLPFLLFLFLLLFVLVLVLIDVAHAHAHALAVFIVIFPPRALHLVLGLALVLDIDLNIVLMARLILVSLALLFFLNFSSWCCHCYYDRRRRMTSSWPTPPCRGLCTGKAASSPCLPPLSPSSRTSGFSLGQGRSGTSLPSEGV